MSTTSSDCTVKVTEDGQFSADSAHISTIDVTTLRSVSLDADSKEWITGIAVDQLTWPQISNLKQWDDPIAKKYNITTIPATFVLDADGKIVAKDIKGEELRKKVAELISK